MGRIFFTLTNSFHSISVCLAWHCSTKMASLKDIKHNQRSLMNLSLSQGTTSFRGPLWIAPATCHVPHTAFSLGATTKSWENRPQEPRPRGWESKAWSELLSKVLGSYTFPRILLKAPSAFPHPWSYFSITSTNCSVWYPPLLRWPQCILWMPTTFIAAVSIDKKRNACCICRGNIFSRETPVHIKQLVSGYQIVGQNKLWLKTHFLFPLSHLAGEMCSCQVIRATPQEDSVEYVRKLRSCIYCDHW